MKNKDTKDRNKPKVTDVSLLEEIMPLMKDYFMGKFSLGEKGITYIMPNGQMFIITATQVQI